MNILITIVAVIFITVSAFVTRNQKIDKTEENVLPAETAINEEEVPSPTPEAVITSTPQGTFIATATPFSESQNISQFVYPGATIISQSSASVSLISSDDPGKITSWYEEKIKSMGYSAKSFVKTSANGEILNKLSAAKSGEKIMVEITKSPEDSQTKIKIELDND